MSQAEIHTRLLSSRHELLDISLRNNMLDFKLSKTSLALVGEQAEAVVKTLCKQHRSMVFASIPSRDQREAALNGPQPGEAEAAPLDQGGADRELWPRLDEPDEAEPAPPSPSPEPLPSIGSDSNRLTDNKLQTALSAEDLFKRLLKIQTAAEDFIQEQGVNVLFLAVGFLHWYEDARSDRLRRAPLVLVPVQLKRGGPNGGTFRLEYSGDELGRNLSLELKLKNDFKLDWPHYAVETFAESEELPSLEHFFASVAESISSQPRWRIKPDEICLGFFSFGKYLMFHDLDPDTWPVGKKPEDHPILRQLLGEGGTQEAPAFDEHARVDTILQHHPVHFVMDADSSQTRAIMEAGAGRNVVIQGPPGTGKSQTIANIIAECLGQGKTVLFVAEKMAALEVVKRRLDKAQLGDAVLELHSRKAIKLALIRELERTLTQGKPQIADTSEQTRALIALRDQLTAHCEAINAPVGSSGIPFINALGQYLQLRREQTDLQSWSFDPMHGWSFDDYLRQRQVVAEMARQLELMGRPSSHSFWGTTRAAFSPLDATQVNQWLSQAIAHEQQLTRMALPLTEQLGLPAQPTLANARQISDVLRRLLDAPDLAEARLAAPEWLPQAEAIRSLIAAGHRMGAVRARYADALGESAWDQDLRGERQLLAQYGGKWWRRWSGTYRQLLARLQTLCAMPLPQDPAAQLALVDAVLEFQHHRSVCQHYAALGQALFGARWQGQASDWPALSQLSEWIIALHNDVQNGQLPPKTCAFLLSCPTRQELERISAALLNESQQCSLRLADILNALALHQPYPLADLAQWALQRLDELLGYWRRELDGMYAISRFNQISINLTQAGLHEIAEQAANWDASGDQFLRAFDWTWYSGLMRQAYAERPQLSQFDRIRHESLIEAFRNLDKSSLRSNQDSLAAQLWDGLPLISQAGEMDIIRREINKKKRHLPIRKLLNETSRAIQRIKPVFMMSPISIANFLPPGRIEFDVVIFDEASQIKAVDAFGAILRGRQLIVVGDTRQMPPTDFFNREVELDDDDNLTNDIESILAMCRARGIQERFLAWHYRSRHESLIAVSNLEFYDRKLIIFPSPGTNSNATGLKFRHVQGATYDRGGKRTNPDEARQVAQAVVRHATARPQLSLGVVAFSMAQREQIQLEIEQLRRESPALEQFITSHHQGEPFFIKNLENVQGDERDVIFISVGYGRGESGRIDKNFGPINREGGERRLNVLITRAKLAMEIFSSFRADELELDGAAKHGPRALKRFLSYAENGDLRLPRETGRAADSPFEREVLLALQERGYAVEPQVGSAGYFIDIAVRDPAAPGRYVLAIECDGASYHSAQSARDRDRLRQAVLEGLGWRFHRIWSAEWFRNPGQETDRAVAAIEQARQLSAAPAPPAAEPPEIEPPALQRFSREERMPDAAAEPYRKAELGQLPAFNAPELHMVDPRQLAYTIKAVVAAEAPVHQEAVTRRLLARYGLGRAGNRIVAAINQAIAAGVAAGLFVHADGFLYADGQRPARIRSRAGLEPAERKIELVAPEELEAALLETVRLGFSIKPEAAIDKALELLGFNRATKRMNQLMAARIDALLAARRLAQVGGMLTSP